MHFTTAASNKSSQWADHHCRVALSINDNSSSVEAHCCFCWRLSHRSCPYCCAFLSYTHHRGRCPFSEMCENKDGFVDSLNSFHRCPELRTISWGLRVYSKWISTSTCFRFFSVLVPYLCVLLRSTVRATSPRVLHIHSPLLLHVPSSCGRISQ